MKPNLTAAIATHLNAPYGAVVREETVITALKTGTFQGIACGDLELELLKTMFVECSPSLIGRACYEVGTDLENAHKLYLELLKNGHTIVVRWQDAVKDIVA